MQPDLKIAHRLLKNKKTLAIAESCTGGLVSHRLTNIPGSSGFLLGSVISYSNESKIQILKTPSSLIRKHGAVSAQVAQKMAQGIRKLLKTDFGIGITGIAGPGGGTEQKPVGLTFIAVAFGHKVICERNVFQGRRIEIKQQAASRALNLLAEYL